MTVPTRALLVFPRATGSASRTTKTKRRNTSTMAERETRRIAFSASHSAGRPRWLARLAQVGRERAVFMRSFRAQFRRQREIADFPDHALAVIAANPVQVGGDVAGVHGGIHVDEKV